MGRQVAAAAAAAAAAAGGGGKHLATCTRHYHGGQAGGLYGECSAQIKTNVAKLVKS